MDSLTNCELVPTETRLVLSETSLLSLDDLVIYKIMKHLTIVDLANLCETCKRLESLANEHLRKYHSSVHWMNYTNSESSRGNTIRPTESERVFKHIGKHVKTIKLSNWTDFEFYEILVTLAQHCHQMDTLILESIRISRPLTLCVPLIRLMFSKLTRFALNGCFWMGWCPLHIFFGNNEKLEDLAVINCCAHNGYGYRLELAGFRSLKKLRLIRCRNVVTEKELMICFGNNNITSLVLTDIGNVNIFKEQTVVDYLSDTVDDISIDYSNGIIADQLLRLKKLKALRLRCTVYSDIDSLLSTLGPDNSIEELVIVKLCISGDTVEALKNFKNLKRLRLDQIVNSVPRQFFRALPKILPHLQQFVYANSTIRDEDILHMFKLMPQLTRLSLFGCNALSTKTYLEMMNVLDNDWHRPQLELIPPKWETTKSLETVKSVNKKILLRTEITVINSSTS